MKLYSDLSQQPDLNPGTHGIQSILFSIINFVAILQHHQMGNLKLTENRTFFRETSYTKLYKRLTRKVLFVGMLGNQWQKLKSLRNQEVGEVSPPPHTPDPPAHPILTRFFFKKQLQTANRIKQKGINVDWIKGIEQVNQRSLLSKLSSPPNN